MMSNTVLSHVSKRFVVNRLDVHLDEANVTIFMANNSPQRA
jgi:hypothetical protein